MPRAGTWSCSATAWRPTRTSVPIPRASACTSCWASASACCSLCACWSSASPARPARALGARLCAGTLAAAPWNPTTTRTTTTTRKTR